MGIINKDRFPHIYEFERLGRDDTHEGRRYNAEYQSELYYEYSIYIDMKHIRTLMGGSDAIHKPKDY